MRTSIIILYVLIAGLLIVAIMQWMQIRNIKAATVAAVTAAAQKTDTLASSSFGDMLNQLKKNLSEVDLKF